VSQSSPDPPLRANHARDPDGDASPRRGRTLIVWPALLVVVALVVALVSDVL
jgi:hypothetical protein